MKIHTIDKVYYSGLIFTTYAMQLVLCYTIEYSQGDQGH